MQAMILAAGFGSRLKPLTSRVPKPLVACAGRRLIDYSFDLVQALGCERVIINAHHLAEELQRRMAQRLPYGMEIIWSVEEELRGTGGALKEVEGLIDDTLLLANADIMIELDAAAMLRAHATSSARATLALHPAHDGEDYGVVRRDADGWVTDIVGGVAKLETGYERAAAEGTTLPPLPEPSSKGSACYFRGVHLLEPAAIAALPDTLFSCVVRQGHIPQIADGAKVHGYMCQGSWADAGTPQRLMDAHELFWRAEAPVVERGAYIGLKTELHGKTHVAAGADVGHSCHLTDVLVQPDAVVPPRTVLNRAIVYGRRGQAWTFDDPT